MVKCLEDKSPYYAKTLVFIQSSGMGKSRLADTFGGFCPMINFVLREPGDGYPPPDSEILAFMRKPPSKKDYELIFNSPSKDSHATPHEFAEKRVAVVWNHSIAVGLLQASLEACEFPPLLPFSLC
jgi:hypothetical protein